MLFFCINLISTPCHHMPAELGELRQTDAHAANSRTYGPHCGFACGGTCPRAALPRLLTQRDDKQWCRKVSKPRSRINKSQASPNRGTLPARRGQPKRSMPEPSRFFVRGTVAGVHGATRDPVPSNLAHMSSSSVTGPFSNSSLFFEADTFSISNVLPSLAVPRWWDVDGQTVAVWASRTSNRAHLLPLARCRSRSRPSPQPVRQRHQC